MKDKLKVAISRKELQYINEDLKSKFDFIYIFEFEEFERLKKTKLHCIKYDYLDNFSVDINLTNYDIECSKKTTIKDKEWFKMPDKKDFKFGIIIPNFNYEEWVEKCLKSILNQTYTNYQIVFVDDMSVDNSVKIAKSLLKSPHKVVQLKQKRLNGGARNEAYLHLDNDVDYVMYVDSDDWLLNENVLEIINDKLQARPDVLFIGMSDFKNNITKQCYIPEYKDKYEAMKGWSGSCGKIIKKDLATRQECLYPEGTLKEDRNQHRKICIYMNSFGLLKKPLYVWNKSNKKSITTIREEKIWGTSTIRHYADTLQLYLEQKGKDKKVDQILEEAVEKCKEELNGKGDRQW